jgi:hypothetical protein
MNDLFHSGVIQPVRRVDQFLAKRGGSAIVDALASTANFLNGHDWRAGA